MPTPVYQQIDAKNTLYDNVTLTADGNSTALDFGIVGGCPEGEILIKTGDMEGTGTIDFYVQDYNGSWADTHLVARLVAASNGVYSIPVNNNIVKGSQLRIRHDITAGTDGDGIVVSAHLRPARAAHY